MTDTTGTPPASQNDQTAPAAGQAAPAAPAAAVVSGSVDATSPPAGFVPQTELDRAMALAREHQGRADRLQHQLRAVVDPDSGDKGGASGTTTQGFDPESFQSQLLDRVYGSVTMIQAAPTLQAEFPHADPAFFDPDTLKEFGSVEALRAAVEADHKRIEAIIAAVSGAAPVAGTAVGTPSPLGPAGAGGQAVGGTPTPAQIAAMNPAEFNAFVEKNPGVVESVLAQYGGPVA